MRRAGHGVRVFERSPQLRVADSGITLAANDVEALRILGVSDKACAAGYPFRYADLRTSDGRVLTTFPMARLEERVGVPSIGIHRTALLEILHEAAGPENVQGSSQCTGYRKTGDKVVLELADGREETGDILIGADGPFSAIRDQLRGPATRRYSGYTCWRGNAELTADEIGCDGFFEAWGRGARFGGVMIGPRKFTWYAVLNAPAGGKDAPGTLKARVTELFGGWAEPVPSLIAASDGDAIFRVDIGDVRPDPRWTDGRVALLGDAAHAITPNMGQGACQALEDVVVLADRLASASDPVEGLKAYARARHRRAGAIVNASWRIGRFTQMEGRLPCALRDLSVRLLPKPVLNAVFDQAGAITRLAS